MGLTMAANYRINNKGLDMKSVTIRTTFDIICRAIPEYSNLVVSRNDANLLFTGAKAYYLGGGWWRISGYSWDGGDVDKVLDKLNS